MENKRERIHDWLRRSLALLMALVMVVTMLPLNVFADDFLYDHIDKEKSGFINKLPVEPAKPEEGKTATDLITNPRMPEIYTLRTDYKVRKNQDWKINYQPYVASVGKNATPEEQARVKKTIDIPELKGYDKPAKTTFDITYDGVVKEAKKGSNQGVYYQKNKDVRYEPKDSVVKVKHVFQSLTDFNEYGLRDGETEDKYTEAIGKTGNLLEVQALDPNLIPGFEAEADVLSTMVPEDTTDFVVEYRYNRKSYDVDYDTEGGTDVASRLLYYGQKIPGAEEPKKNGSIFLGWKPSCELKGVVDNTEKTFKKNEIITNGAGNPIKDLKANLVMPAEDVVFTAVWKDAPKADYLIQFWTEKPDYDDKDDTLPLRDRYDYIGSRRIENADTGLRPNLTNLPIDGITFPDLNDGRLEKAQNDPEEFARYYFLNEELTKKQNRSEKDPNVQKSVLSTGETVYNVYYDRRVYTLYFTAANELAFENAGSFWPIITREGQVIGKEGDPYKVAVRFNQSLNKIWPKDAEVSNLPPGSSDPEGDTGLIGWIINNNAGESAFRDTPPYRLSAEDFIDSQDVVGEGEFEGFGHADQIPIGENQTKARDKYEISIGSTSLDTAVVHHIDIIKDDFDGKEQIDYDMSYWKSDTNAVEYPFILPNLQGFTLKEERREAEWVLEEPTDKPTDNQYRTINDLNRDRNKITPFRSDADKIKYIPKFPWGTKLFKGKNAYNYANYTRNKYKLKLNDDPKNIKNDNEYTDGKDRFDVFYEKPLKDLNLDEDHVPEKPAWVPENWVFKGWALDPAGENLLKFGNETKLHYDQFLFAKWDEPDYSWKVTVDPNGGEMKDLTEDDIIDRRVTNNRGEEVKDVAQKEANVGDKQIFTVKHRQRLQQPPRPTRKGYNFLGWELVRYNKDKSEDTSYRDVYHVPELYAFSNDLVSHVYLRAIWLKNDRVDVPVYHHFIDSEGNEIESPRDPFIIEDARVGYYTAAAATAQDAEWILMSHEELEALADDNPVKQQYVAYNEVKKFNNADFHSLRVEPKKILQDGNEADNPKAKNNVFHFYYRRFRTRNYKVNYLDERAKAELEKATTADEKQAIIEKYRIIPQENVVSKNRHFDARNYRPIPGWTLASDAQQQLFYDIIENTGEFLGINGTGSDEITFYYKDVRVIEVPDPKEPVPKGYVRVTFKADRGGSFTDNTGKSVKELHYDVIKGLKSDLLPVPGDPVADDKKEAGKYYITPEAGKAFTKWNNKPLLNKNTLLENEDKDAYTFTAYFEWSGLTASGLVRTEAFKDDKADATKDWSNKFAPTIEDLKKQLVWKEKDQEKPLPEGATVKFFEENGHELKTDEDVYNLVNEKNKADKDELVRTVNIKAKVTFTNGKDPQELDIPIKVYKNVYEALNKEGHKPLFLSEAEKGELKDITGEYVKVTVAPTGDMTSKDNKVYYVNPKAWVNIPEVNADGSSTFVNWTADQVNQNEDNKANGKFDFDKRHMFTTDTVIQPVGAADVVEQTDPNKKPDVPNSYVKVIVKTTDKATDDTAFEKTFWVNPKAEVAIDVTNPTGKEKQKVNLQGLGEKEVTYTFKEWQKVKAGEAEDSLKDITPEKIDLARNKFTDKVTVIEAAYKKSIQAESIVKPLKTTKLDTPQGKEITNDDLIKQITPQEGKEIESITIVESPDPSKPGEQDAKVIVKYKDGTTQGTNDNPVVIPVEVHKNIIPANPDGTKPKDALDNYVKVIFKAGTGGSVSGDLVYYVSPEVEVDMTESAKAVTKTPSVGYTANGGTWSPDIKAEKITAEKTYEFNFVKTDDIVEKIDENTKIPDGYVIVKFIAGKNGKIKGGDKTYYVNPTAGIRLVDTATQGAKNELVIPETEANANYAFEKWVETIDYTNPITGNREYVAHFAIGQLTLTYNAGDGTGIVPEKQTAPYGGKVILAKADGLSKENHNFAGWKIGDITYKVGDEITLTQNTTATAQWKANTHTVTFNTMGGSDVPKQEIEHGGKLVQKAIDDPTKDGFVFMGWKEKGKEAEANYFDFETLIEEDKTLIAQWQEPVQKIDENDPVEEQFIKVTFNQGAHGQLVPDKDKQDIKAATVTYKVAKDYTFEKAIEKGLVVPGIAPANYYKAVDANSGWDKELKLEGQNTTFIAQYEPVADVIPIDPNVTPDDKLQDDKPEGMVLVQFKVADDTKFYLDKNVKYYVKQDTEVRIPTPVVLNKNIGEAFKGWLDVNVVKEPIEATQDPNAKTFEWVKQSFKTDTTITDEHLVEPKIFITAPKAGAKIVYIETLDGEVGKLQVVGHDTIYENTTYTRRGKSYKVFRLDQALKIGDGIRYWAEASGKASMVKENVIQ